MAQNHVRKPGNMEKAEKQETVSEHKNNDSRMINQAAKPGEHILKQLLNI